MARKTKEVQIDGLRYRIRQVGGMDGLRLKAMATRLLGAPIATVLTRGGLDALMNLDTSNDADRKVIEDAFAQLTASLSEDGIVKLAGLMIYRNVSFENRVVLGDTTSSDWVEIYDEADYAAAVDRSDNPLHDAQLFAQCLMANLLPTSAAARTDQAERSGPRAVASE